MTKRCFLFTFVAFIYHCLTFTHMHVPIVLFFLRGIVAGQNICSAGGDFFLSLVHTQNASPGLPGWFCHDDSWMVDTVFVWMVFGLHNLPLFTLIVYQYQITLNPIVTKQNHRNVIMPWSSLGSPISLKWLLWLPPNLISCNSLGALRALSYLLLIPLKND